MSTQGIIRMILMILFYIILQVVLIRNLVLFDLAFCFVYLLGIIILPGDLPTGFVILISFFIGLIVDIFYNTAGVHSAACTLVGFNRKMILRSLIPSKGIENNLQVELDELGPGRYFRYILFIIVLHHLALFMIEAGGFQHFGLTMAKVGCSILFTTFAIYLLSLFTSSIKK